MRQMPHYSRIGRVKSTNDGARLLRNQHIRLRNLSVPPGWVGMIDVQLQSLQSLTLPYRNHDYILLQEVCCTLYLISTITPNP